MSLSNFFPIINISCIYPCSNNIIQASIHFLQSCLCDSILKTKLAAIIVDDNSERVRETFRAIPEEQIKEFVIYGTPEDVSRQIQMLEEIGIQYLIVDLEPSRELEALDMFANKIINKMSLSGMDGYEFVKQVKKINPKVKIILMTAFEIEDKELSRISTDVKVDAFIKKPFSFVSLKSIIVQQQKLS